MFDARRREEVGYRRAPHGAQDKGKASRRPAEVAVYGDGDFVVANGIFVLWVCILRTR